MTTRDYSKLVHKEELDEYIQYGVYPSDFLVAVFSNDLLAAHMYGTPTDIKQLEDYIAYLVDECPPESYGSPECFGAWCNRCGAVSWND